MARRKKKEQQLKSYQESGADYLKRTGLNANQESGADYLSRTKAGKPWQQQKQQAAQDGLIGSALSRVNARMQQDRARDAALANTKYWQQAAQDAAHSQNGDQSWQVYMAKQISDTPGGYDQWKAEQRRNSERETAKNRKLVQDMTYSGRHGTEDAYKLLQQGYSADQARQLIQRSDDIEDWYAKQTLRDRYRNLDADKKSGLYDWSDHPEVLDLTSWKTARGWINQQDYDINKTKQELSTARQQEEGYKKFIEGRRTRSAMAAAEERGGAPGNYAGELYDLLNNYDPEEPDEKHEQARNEALRNAENALREMNYGGVDFTKGDRNKVREYLYSMISGGRDTYADAAARLNAEGSEEAIAKRRAELQAESEGERNITLRAARDTLDGMMRGNAPRKAQIGRGARTDEDNEIARGYLYDSIMPDSYEERIAKYEEEGDQERIRKLNEALDNAMMAQMTGQDVDEYAGAIFDTVNGGDIEQKMGEEELPSAKKQQLDEILDRMIEMGPQRNMFYTQEYLADADDYLEEPEVQAAQKLNRATQDRIKELEAEERMLAKYNGYITKYSLGNNGQYKPENDRGLDNPWQTQSDEDRGIQTTDVNRIYSYINGGKEWQAWATKYGTAEPQLTDEYDYAGMMNDTEIRIFNNFYNYGRYDEARQFLDGLKATGVLGARYREVESIRTQEAAKKMPITSSIGAQAMTTVNTALGPAQVLAGLMGDESVKDPNSNWYAPARQSEEIQSTIAQELGPYGQTYLVGMNSIRNVINGFITKGMGVTGKASQTVASLGVFASQIYQESTYKYLAETGDYNETRGLAALDAVMETAEELLPYEAMLSHYGGRPIIAYLANALSEAGEEFTGATVGDKIKGLITGRDSVEKRGDEIFAAGGYYDKKGQWVELDKSDTKKAVNEADAQALREKGEEIINNTLAGFAGGGLGALYSGLTYTVDTYNQGRQVSSERNNYAGMTGAERLAQLGAGMKEGTQSHKIANQVLDTIQEGKKPNNYTLGKLYQAIATETGEEQAEVARETVERTVREQLAAAGVTGDEAEEYAGIIAKGALEGGRLDMHDRTVLARSAEAIKVWQEYQTVTPTTVEVVDRIDQATAKQKSVMDTLGELTQETVKSSGVTADEVDRAIRRTKSDAEAIDYLQKTNPNLMSEEYAKTAKEILESDPEAKKTKRYVDDVMKIRMAALTYRENMPATNLTKESAQKLFAAAQKEAAEADRLRLENNKALQPGRGVATFEGAEYGTDEWTEKVKAQPKQVRNQMIMAAEVAKRFGHTVEFINDPEREMVNGWQIAQDGNIVINIASASGRRMHNMLATAVHEMTHWLEHNSENGYANLRSFILNSLEKNGEDIGEMVMRTIRNQDMVRAKEEASGKKSSIPQLTVSDAVAEIVAKGSEGILSSKEMKEALAKEDPGLYDKVKEFVKNFIARLDNALQGIDTSLSREARALKEERDQIAKLWLEAREDANGSKQAAEEISPAKAAQMSVEQLDETYMQAVESGDMETAQMLVEAAAEKAMPDSKMRLKNGKLRKLYHGTYSDMFTVFDPALIGTAREGDVGFFGKGFYFAYTKGEASFYGRNVMEVYLNMVKPFNYQQNLQYMDGKRTTDYNASRAVFVTRFADMFPELANSHYVTVLEQGADTAKRLSLKEFGEIYKKAIRDQKFKIEKVNGEYGDEWLALSDKKTEKYTDREGKERSYTYYDFQQRYMNEEDARNQLTNAYLYLAKSVYDNIDIPNPTVIVMETELSQALQERGYDGVIQSEDGDEAVVFDSKQIKLADPVTYDKNNKPISLSERFNKTEPDIRYSLSDIENEDIGTVKQGEDPVDIVDDDGEAVLTLLPGNTVASTQFSLSSYYELGERRKMINALTKAGFSEEQIADWMESLDNIAAKIASDRVKYDFVADRTKKFLKPNGDVYKKTLDANTMCKKTRLYNGTFNAVQHMMPNTVFMPEDLIDLFNIMKSRHLETPCGFCYVQSRRRHLGPYTKEWLEHYKGEYIPKVEEVTTSDGLEKLKTEHPQTYKDFVKAMNKKGVNNPKLVQARTDYRGEIRRINTKTIEYLKAIGGLRMQSFSDFEVVHMLDIMQAVMDMKAKGLTAQAYTKVPEFAWIFGPTGIKINLSLVGRGTGLNAKGQLVFDDYEGMDPEEAFKLREAYSDNVGTVLVGINDEHIIAAMGDGRIDFIIPFHKSGWSENELKHMMGLDHYKDYTDTQNEYNITGTDENGKLITEKAESNIDPLSYWKFELSGEENARIYLQKCADMKIIPKFPQFLVDKGNGVYALPEGDSQREKNIREGYWKTLIDFKMYNNEGVGAAQQLVEPNFNMEQAMAILNEYDGSHRQLPKDMKAAREFVKQYKKAHPLDDVRTQYSVEEIDDQYMQAVKNGDTETAQQLVYEAAKRAGYTDKAYHGTNVFGFTQFDPEVEDQIFVAYDDELAGTYTRDKDIRPVSEKPSYDYSKLLKDQHKMAEMARKKISNLYGVRVNNITYKTSEEMGQEADDKFESDILERINTNKKLVRQAYVNYKSNGEEIDAFGSNEEKDLLKQLITENSDITEKELNDTLFKIIKLLESARHPYGMFEFDVQNRGHIPVYFDQRMVLDWIVEANGDKGGIYELYVKPGKQLVIDAEDSRWDNITVPWSETTVTTRDIAKYAKENGYNSVRINNVLDYGNYRNDEMRETGDIGIVFNPTDVKSADNVTYDDQGNVIPLSERFNPQKEDIRYSVEESPDMDVSRFMVGLNETSLKTVQERTMLRQFKGLQTNIDLYQMAAADNKRAIRKLEAKEKKDGKLSAYDRNELSKQRNLLKNNEERVDMLRRSLVKVTQDGGFAKLMYKQAKMMDRLVTGRTADEVRSTVRAMNDELENVTKEMAARSERLKKLAEKEAVLRIRQQFNRAGLRRIATKLKSEMNSDLDVETIENRLALIALKMKQEQFDKENTTELADLLVGKMHKAYDSYVLDELRGRTIVLGKAAMAELKGQNRTLADVRKELAGTGIRISSKGTGTLDQNWDELCDIIPGLDRNTNSGDQLDALLDVIRSEKRMTANEYGSDENMVQISAKILEAAQELMPEIVTSEKNMNAIREALKFVAEMTGEAKEAAGAMDEVNQMIRNLQKKQTAAAEGTEKLAGDIRDAIDYFNELGEQSEAAMWKSERVKLIEQLKSKNTQDLLAEQAKWKAKIEKDAEARQQAESNMSLRKKINTNYSRIRKLIVNETDQKNVPEHMKSLARYMLQLLTENDLVGRKITGMDKKDLADTLRVLGVMSEQDGDFTIDDLQLITDEEAQAQVADALADLEEGIEEYNRSPGKGLMENLQSFGASLAKIQDAVAVISSVINAERSISFLDRRQDVADFAETVRHDMGRSRFKGEWRGRGSKALNTAKNAVVYGNTTPVYFFKNLMNRGMQALWNDMAKSEDRNGLETQKAQDFMRGLGERTHYRDWAGQTHEVTLGGKKMTLTIGNMMELYAIWKREQTTNPEMSQHLSKGGVFIQKSANANEEGRLRREKEVNRATRVTDEEIAKIYDTLTKEQKEYLDSVVKYLSNDMSELGNEASMRMYGIKKYKESYYFPMKVWDGVKSARSDRGISGTDENRMAHRSWSKRRQHMAKNALVIGDFTEDAVRHIVEMINYNTMAPAIENLNKVLNYRFTEGEDADTETQRNLRVMFEEAYGKEALKYLETFMKDLNGGTVQDQRKTLRDRMLTIFKKNAVAGSLSVAMQQPLSYIRAAMMVSPKYLAGALNPQYYKGSYREMIEHSGVAVIKNMGRFDMNFGQSAKDYITPETKGNAYEKVSDLLTKLPQLMDTMTWTRMWSAVKMEQHALNPGMDMKSEAFLNKVAERFGDLMRRTQVYDSVMVKSQNMRSQNIGMKIITSFMAEPTLSLNVLADAVRNVGQEGGKANLAKAGATFMLSAVMQALVKALMGSGRTPDKKKTWEENFWNKFGYNLINEVDPAGLIPGFNDMIEVLKNGELTDDAMSIIGKLTSVWQTASRAVNGNGKGAWRDIEDTAGQLAQMFTNIPAKNILRDTRAMANFFGAVTGISAEGLTGDAYANRPTSGAVIRKQMLENIHTADNLIGVVNQWLGDAGYKTDNKAYYERLYKAERAGNTQAAEEIREYMMAGKGIKSEQTIDQQMRGMIKNDAGMTDSEKIKALRDKGMKDSDIASWIAGRYKDGEITKDKAVKLYLEANPKKTKDEAYFYFEQAEWEARTGKDVGTSDYFRLNDAVDSGNAAEYKRAAAELENHGHSAEEVEKHTKSRITANYKDGKITKQAAQRQMKELVKLDENESWWTLDRIDYQKETKKEDSVSGYYYRLTDAVNANRQEQITSAVQQLLKHGITKDKIKSKLSDWKSEYLKADSAGRIRIRDAITKAYKAAGYTKADADKTIEGWKKDEKKKTNKK